VFDRVGLFDPDLKSLGDGEWVIRATGLGEVLRYADAALVQASPAAAHFGAVFRKSAAHRGRPGAPFEKGTGKSPGELAADIYRYSVLNPRIQRYALRFPGSPRGRVLRFRMFFLVEFLSLANSASKRSACCCERRPIAAKGLGRHLLICSKINKWRPAPLIPTNRRVRARPCARPGVSWRRSS
jgi:hypothetical protein